MKIVINTCYGGFGLSDEALADLGIEDYRLYDRGFRTNEALVALIEEKGSDYCSDRLSSLKVVKIPDEATDWEIPEYDGAEEVLAVIKGKICHFR